MKQILVIEDDLDLQQALVQLLQSSGYTAVASADFEPKQFLSSHFDCLLLDLNLPRMNGLQVIQEIRKASDVPIIMLTSSASETDEALSLGYGADDYITKPYNPNILLLHLAAVLRRSEATNSPMSYRDLQVDLDRGVIKNHQRRALLTKNEMIILRHLLDSQGKIVTRDALMTDLWNNQEYINDNALTVNISRLRSKLDSLGAKDAIETRKGLGYILQ